MAQEDADEIRRDVGESLTMTAAELERSSRWRYSPMNWGHDPVKKS